MNTAIKLVNDQPTPGRKDYINQFRSSAPKEGVLFKDFITLTVSRKVKRMGDNYRSNYNTLIYHLNRFAEKYDVDIFTNSVNEAFLDDFISYLEDEDLKQSYIKAMLSLVKSMIRKAGTYGYSVDASYDDVSVDDDEPFSVYLSMNEITRIYYFKGLTKAKERIRDLFIVGCLTAMRYSDYSTLTRLNFKGDYIDKTTKKTNKRVIIPVHDYIREIYDKYDGEISKGLSLQHFNRYIKKVMLAVGLVEPITFSYIRGGSVVTETKEKWELISSHTARRSAATNMYLTGRLKTYEIMSITGHTTEKSFFRYIRVTNENISKQLAVDNYFRK